MNTGGGNQTVTSKVDLTDEQKKLVDMAMPFATQYAAAQPQASTISGNLNQPTNANQTGGQNAALGAIPKVNQLANTGAGSSNFLLNNALFPNSNPALTATIDAATRPIADNLTQNELPQIRSGATMAGQYGGSRQGIAEGLAIGKTNQAIGDTAAKVATTGYNSGLDAMTKALGLLPSTQQAQTAGGVIQSGVGDVQQAQGQQQINADVAKQLYNAQAPYNTAANLTNLALGQPGAGSSTTQPAGYTNPLSGAMGGASLGASIGGVPGALAGGGLGALLAFL